MERKVTVSIGKSLMALLTLYFIKFGHITFV